MKRYQQSMSFYAPKEYTHTVLRPSVMRYQCRFKCMEKNIRLWANWNARGGVCILAIRYPVGNRFLAHLHSCNIHFLLAYLHTYHTLYITYILLMYKWYPLSYNFTHMHTYFEYLPPYFHICSKFLSLNTLPPLHCVPVNLDTCKKNSLAQACQHSTTSTWTCNLIPKALRFRCVMHYATWG